MQTPSARTPEAHSSHSMRPSRTRFWVIVFAVTLAILAYIDRVAISKAMPFISAELNLTDVQKGMIFSSFGLAYALFEIPGGWLGDALGPRKVLLRIVLWWSFFTASVAWMWSATALMVNQFLFGAGEAGCFPNLTKSFTAWLRPQERVRAQGIMWMAARWGGAFTPLIFVWLYSFVPWRWVFAIFALLGLIWAVLFYRWFRDNPKDHPKVNAAEYELLKDQAHLAGGHGNVPWAKFAKSRSVWLLWAQYFLITYPWYFYITWLTTYLLQGRNLDDQTSARYAIFPLLFGGIGCVLSGFFTPYFARMVGGMKPARRILGVVGFLGAAGFLFLSINTANPLYAMIAMGMSSFCNDLVMPGAWGACMDVGGKYAGTLSGSMNMMGNLAGFVAPNVAGIMLQSTSRNWDMFLYTMVGSYLLGALCWPLLDPVTPIEDRNEPHHAHA